MIILKYSKIFDNRTALMILNLEAWILTKIEPHKHIIDYKNQREDDLLLKCTQWELIAQFLKDYTLTWQ